MASAMRQCDLLVGPFGDASGTPSAHGHCPAGWSTNSLIRVQGGTWEKPMGKAEQRVRTAKQTGASAGTKAYLWNTYIASLVPYPTLIAPMTDGVKTEWRQHLRSLFPLTGWDPLVATYGPRHRLGREGWPAVPYRSLPSGSCARHAAHRLMGPVSLPATRTNGLAALPGMGSVHL